jgi:hypothetical protein
MAAAVLNNFTVMENKVLDDTTFIGSVGPNCSTTDITPEPEPFVFNSSQIINSQMQSEFVERDADALTCILPDHDDWWPFMPSSTTSVPGATSTSVPGIPDATSTEQASSGGKKSQVPMALGLTFGILAALLLSFFVRRWYMEKTRYQRRLY